MDRKQKKEFLIIAVGLLVLLSCMSFLLRSCSDQKAKQAQQKKGRYYTALYKQAGNSIAVPIFESIFRKIILNETQERREQT